MVGDLGSVTGGLTQNSKRDAFPVHLPFLRVANVYANELRLDQISEIGVQDSEVPRVLLEKGDLLVVEGNGSLDQIGRVAVWNGAIEPCLHQNHLIKVRFAPITIGRFALYWFLSSVGRDQITRVASSTSGLHTLSIAKVQALEMPLAPLREQGRIAGAIESYFTRLDDAVATLERVERNLKRYRASVLKSAVEGRLVPTEAELAKQEGRDYEPASVLLERILAERRRRWSESGKKGKYQEPVPPNTTNLPNLPEGWCWATVDQLITESLANGRSVPTATQGFPVLRLTALKDGSVDLSERKIGAWTREEAELYLVKLGDFLIARGNGSIRLVGRGGLLRQSPDEVAYPDTLIRVRLSSAILPGLFGQLWESRWIRDQIEKKAKTTAGIYKINQTDLAECVLPLMPHSEQHRLLEEIERQTSFATTNTKSVLFALSRAGRLRQSILKWAFEGRLADQDPDDEPASVLLERITREPERAKSAEATRQQRGTKRKQVRV